MQPPPLSVALPCCVRERRVRAGWERVGRCGGCCVCVWLLPERVDLHSPPARKTDARWQVCQWAKVCGARQHRASLFETRSQHGTVKIVYQIALGSSAVLCAREASSSGVGASGEVRGVLCVCAVAARARRSRLAACPKNRRSLAGVSVGKGVSSVLAGVSSVLALDLVESNHI